MLRSYLFLLVPLLAGYLFGKTNFLPKQTTAVLNFFVINIALPATILINIPDIKISSELLIPFAAQWVSVVTGALIVAVISRLFKFERIITGTLLLVVPLGNTAFLGLSIIPVFFGRDGIPYGIMYDQLGSFLALATYGAAIAGMYGKSDGMGLKSLVKNVVLFPPFIFLIISFFLNGDIIPEALNDVFLFLSKLLVPAAMLAIGWNLSFKFEKSLLRPLLSALLIRLLAIPVLILLVFFVLDLSGLAAQVSVFQAAMPSMVTAAVLATDKGLNKSLATSIVGSGLVLSLATLPFIYSLIKLILPSP